jgi:hypothetical protein
MKITRWSLSSSYCCALECEIKRGIELKLSKAATEKEAETVKNGIKTTTKPLNDIITIRNDP